MDSKAIIRRLDALQRIADRGRPCNVVIAFTDGSSTTTDQSGALDLLQELGPRGKIDSFQANGALSWWAKMLTILLHPRENRELSDFE